MRLFTFRIGSALPPAVGPDQHDSHNSQHGKASVKDFIAHGLKPFRIDDTVRERAVVVRRCAGLFTAPVYRRR